MRNGTVTLNCNATNLFWDSGGSGANYGNNEDFTLTVCSGDPLQLSVSIGMQTLDLAAGDVLCVYDGNSTAAPLLVCSTDFPAGQTIPNIMATPNNPTGCLTIRFRSNGSGVATGWVGSFFCSKRCQPITAVIDSYKVASKRTVRLLPNDTSYINACPGEEIKIWGKGIYPLNNVRYAQNDTINYMEWNFGDGSQVDYGTSGRNIFTRPGGYTMTFSIRDTAGCVSQNFIKQRIRISPKPDFNIGAGIPNQLCAGSEITLRGRADRIDTSYVVSSQQDTGYFGINEVRSGRLFVPDEPTAPPYATSIFFTQFQPGAVLTDTNNLRRIYVNMEHSWLRDLNIAIICPTGQRANLYNFPGVGVIPPGALGNPVQLGVPGRPDGAPRTDSTVNVAGTGLTYTWIPSATLPTMHYGTVQNGGAGATRQLVPANYRSYDPLANLLGCPLNGQWTLEVTDRWGGDNGWVFFWGIEFAQQLYSRRETFVPRVDSSAWVHNSYTTRYQRDSISARPQNAGAANFVYQVFDNFGCTWDTSVQINMLPYTAPQCFSCQNAFLPLRDTTLCTNDTAFALRLQNTYPENPSVTFEAFPQKAIAGALNPVSNPNARFSPPVSPLLDSINVGYIKGLNLTTPLSMLDSVCFDVNTIASGDMAINLVAPNGAIAQLMTARTRSFGAALRNVCFSTSSTRPFAGAVAPYTGSYMPDGGVTAWNTLLNAPINGKWKVQISDSRGQDIDTVNRWSITFKSGNAYRYTWSPSNLLSCTNCTSPRLNNPSGGPQTVTLSLVDSFNCRHSDTLILNMIDSLARPVVTVNNVTQTMIEFGWTAVTGATGYLVSVNNGPWIAPNGTLSHTVTGLRVGDVVNFRIRAIPSVSSAACGAKIESITQRVQDCIATIGNGSNRRLEIDSILCYGQASPRVNFRFATGIAPFTFQIDNITQNSNAVFTDNIRAGRHTAIFTDGTGCSDTLVFHLGQPDSLRISLRADSVKCFSGATGRVITTASGGTGTLTYSLNFGAPRSIPTFDSLTIGLYQVEIEDRNGCRKTDTISVYEPTALSMSLQATNISCFGGNNGTVRANVSGGTPQYRYLWSRNSADTLALLDTARAGRQVVVVTDAKGCSITDSVTLTQNQRIAITMSQDSANCYGESTAAAHARITGGLAPFRFSWNNSAAVLDSNLTNIRAGLQRVRVIDSLGCIDSATITTLQPDSMRFDSLIGIAERCNNTPTGSARVVVSGGIAPYSYTWANSTNSTATYANIVAGRYIATVKDVKGCRKTDTITVAGRTIVAVDSLILTKPLCSGDANGSIRIRSKGGVGGYTYQWNTTPQQTDSTARNLVAGAYRVTVTDANGCSITKDTNLLQPTALTINLQKQDVRCFGDNTGFVRANVTGGTPQYRYTWSRSTRDTLSLLDTATIGWHHVLVTDANGCTISDSAEILGNSRIVITMSQDSATCFNSATSNAHARIVGGVAPYTFAWNTSSPALDSNLINVRAGIQRVRVTDALGCSDTASIITLQPDSLRFDSLIGIPATCNSTPTGSARVTVSGGTYPYAYSWVGSTQTTSNITGLLAGTYRVTVRDAKNCQRIDSIIVNTRSAIFIDSLIVTNPLCNTDLNGRIRVRSSGGAGGFTYRWNTTPIQTDSNAINLRAGSYRVTITDANGCQLVKDTTLTDPPRLVATMLSAVNVSCRNGKDGAATPSVLGGTPFLSGAPYRYSWNDISAQTTASASSLEAGNYILTVTDANGCTDTANISITQPATAVEATVIQTKTACYGLSTAEARVSAIGGAGGYTYLWSNLQTAQTATRLASQAYYVTVRDANGCTNIDTVNIRAYDSIRIYSTVTPPRCFGLLNGTIRIDSVVGGAANGNLANINYRWSSTPVQSTATATGLRGNANYTVTVTDNSGCTNADTKYMSEPLRMSATTQIQDVKCFGGSDGEAEITASGTNTNFSYLWSQNAASQTAARATRLAAGSYRITITDGLGCTIDTFLQVKEPTRVAVQNETIKSALCAGDSSGALTVLIGGGTPTYKYKWSNGDSIANTITRLRAGSYTVTVTDANNCTMTHSLNVPSPPSLDADIETKSVKCWGDQNGMILVSAMGGTPPYTYSRDDKNFNGAANIVGLRSGGYNVTVKDANNCLWRTPVTIPTPPRFIITAMPDATINLGEKIQLYATPQSNQGNITTSWISPYDTTLSCKKCPNPTASPMYTIIYGIVATDSMGCKATDSVKISVVKPRNIYVPTGFSPNTDGVNDVLMVHGRAGSIVRSFRIYDRWGELVYEARDFNVNDKTIGWDGTFKGEIMNAGVYVWYIDAEYADGEKETLKGNTTIIR